ncbi:unnamed protein product, partial [marine sediment metagenome]
WLQLSEGVKPRLRGFGYLDLGFNLCRLMRNYLMRFT